MAETLARDELARLAPQPDGGWSFRLLQTSLPSLVVGDLTITLVEAVFRIVRTNGGMIERAAATVEVAQATERLRLHLAIGVPQDAFGHTLVLDDLSDGAIPGLPPQFAAHIGCAPPRRSDDSRALCDSR